MRNSMRASLLFTLLLCGATAFAQSHTVTLSWAPAQQSNGITIASWNVLRGTNSGGPYTPLANVAVNTTTYVDSTVSSGTDYYYVVQAVDTDGVSSANSAQVEAVVPTSAPPLAVATTSLPPGTAGQSYSTTVTASGGTGPYAWSGTGVDGLTFSATGILSGTPSASGSFTQTVTVKDSAGNTASASLSLTVSPVSGGSSPAFIQVSSADPQGQNSQVSVTYAGLQTAGDLNVVVAGWHDSVAHISWVTDSMGNTYNLAVGPTVQVGLATQSVFYAANVAAAPAAGNTVTVVFDTGATSPDLRVAEYAGVDQANPVDVVAAAKGRGTVSNSGSVTTANANDLLIGANLVQQSTVGPGSGYTSLVITSPDGDILEDKIVNTAGSRRANAQITGGAWIMQMVAFRASTP